MVTLNLQENPYWLLAHIANKVRHDFGQIAEKYGLTVAQMHALCQILPQAPAPMNTISAQLGCDASYITSIIDRLTVLGYLERRDNPTDRRIKVIVLTTKGEHLREQIIQDVISLKPASLQKLTHKEYEQFHHLLLKITPFYY